jgi:hypothetical protein
MRKPVRNVGASVRARLLNLAKERNQPFELLLIRYTLYAIRLSGFSTVSAKASIVNDLS